MKKFFGLIVALATTMATLFAQEGDGDAMARMRERFKAMTTLTAPVTQTLHNALLADDAVSKGTFYFKKPASMCLTFNDGNDMLLMKDDQFIMVRNGKSSAMRGKGNSQLEALRVLFRNLSTGEESDVSIEDFADVDAERDGDLLTMTIIPRIDDPKARRKMIYTSFVVTVDTRAGALKSIRLNEKGSNYTLYDFGKFTVNAPVDDAVFGIQ